MTRIPAWRSILYVPANVEKFLGRATERGADAILVDLEDSIAPAGKDAARAVLAKAVRMVSGSRAEVGVRINRPLGLAIPDIEAAVSAGASFLCLPKAENAAHVRLLSEYTAECEAKAGVPSGSVGFLPIIESAAALFRAEEIALADPRVVALALGSEDFSGSAGFEPSAEALFVPKQLCLFAARAAGILPVGFLGSVANFSDTEGFSAIIRRSRSMGFQCGFAIHPAQVAILNAEFAPGIDEIAHATALMARAKVEFAAGNGAFQFKGKMVDKPIVDRTQALLDRAREYGLTGDSA